MGMEPYCQADNQATKRGLEARTFHPDEPRIMEITSEYQLGRSSAVANLTEINIGFLSPADNHFPEMLSTASGSNSVVASNVDHSDQTISVRLGQGFSDYYQ